MNESFLKFGDLICLYSDVSQGFLSTIGNNYQNFIVQKTEGLDMALVPNSRSMIFEVVPKLAYQVSQQFNKLVVNKQKLQQVPVLSQDDQDALRRLQNEIKIQEPRRQVEMHNNENTINNYRGDCVVYGMNIQLRHVQSGQFLILSNKSAEQDKTCQKLELTESPSASRVTFQIQPRYRYRQEGDKVVYRDQILLYNIKNNAYINCSKDLPQNPSKDISIPSEFRDKSPKRRRNPENLFNWFEANVSQNFEKWMILNYRQTEDHTIQEFEIHGGDVVRLKHAESGGYITVDDSSSERNGLQEAYVRVYCGSDPDEETTTNQLFELERNCDWLDAAGSAFIWQKDQETGSYICQVGLRHFNSGRLLQVTYFKDGNKIGQLVNLADSFEANMGKIKNFSFTLQSRSMISASQLNLNKESVCSVANTDTKLHLSTQIFAESNGDEESESEEEEKKETEAERKQREFEETEALAAPNSRKKQKKQKELEQIMLQFEEEERKQKELLDSVQVQDDSDQEKGKSKGADKKSFVITPIEVTEENQVFRRISGHTDSFNQNALTLKPKSSMNYVFLPVKENIDVLRDLNFIHSTVPKIKQFLYYIRTNQVDALNLPFFISLMELLKGVIYFVLDIKSDDYMDPFKCDGFPNKLRQKFMRETRLLDLLIDCLIFPFETKLYAYEDLTQQHPITRICQLVYRVLRHSVKENDINKNYVAQWIDLFFKQAMITNESNSFFAEKTIAELLTDNRELLDTQIESSTIRGLINLCLTQPKHERFLNLLAALCQCNGSAITSNQDDICDTIFGKENTDKKKKLLFSITTKKGQHFVNVLDNFDPPSMMQQIPIEEIYAHFSEKNDLRLYYYFEALINLMANVCKERNYKGIKELEHFYTLEMVLDCTLSEKIPYAMRAKFARLLISLHMDKDPLEKLNIPIMTRVWDEVEKETIELPRSNNVPKKLLELKPALENLIRNSKGVCKVYEPDYNLFMLEALKIIETMISLGFYASEQELILMCQPLIMLLDGSTDFYDKYEEELYAQQVQETGDENMPLIKSKDQNLLRYKKTMENEAIMLIKNKVIDICAKIMDIQDNTRLSRFLICYGQLDRRLTADQSKYLQIMMKVNQGGGGVKKYEKQLSLLSDPINQLLEELNKWVVVAFSDKNLDLQLIQSKDFISILLDVNLYDNANLVSNAFSLLVRYFTQKQQILNLATEVQLLQDAEEIAVLEECSLALRQMKKDADNCEFWMGREDEQSLKDSRSFIDRLSALTDLCMYKQNRIIDLGNKKQDKKKKKQGDDAQFQFLNLSEFNEQWDDEDKRICTDYDIMDEQNQRLLRNLRAYDVAMLVIKQKALKNVENKNAYLKVVEKAYIFLIKFVRQNKENQMVILEYISFFLEDIELGVHALELITEIFRDSESLLTFKLVPLIKRIATGIDLLDIETTKKATLLSFVPVFMFYKESYLKENQYLILNEFTASSRKNSNYLFVGQEGFENLEIYMAEMKQQYIEFMNDAKLLAEIDVPPEVSYTISYIQLISYAAQGKNASCETRAQAVFGVQDVIQNLKLADFCYPLKSSLMFFLQNVYFDVEKDIGEDFTKVVWQVLDIVVEDLIKFTEVMQRSKRLAGGGQGAAPSRPNNIGSTLDLESSENPLSTINGVQVDVNKNFTFTTAFGKFKVSELMQKYVFEEVFPSIEAFLNLRLPMKESQASLVATLLKLLFLSVPYKTKPIHEKNIQQFVRSLRNIPALQELGGDVTLSALGISDGDEEGNKIESKVLSISQAQKLKIFMKMTRTDNSIKNQVAKEFEQLVLSIIQIHKRTELAFMGANTIQVKDFINSIIKSTDITSDIPTNLRTQALRIIRKVIESENKNLTTSSADWDTDDWIMFKPQIVDAQNMLLKMNIVPLICRIISYETKREIREEAIRVGIAILLGGHNPSQNAFNDYIINDNDNDFCRAMVDLIQECFELIKKNQVKRNQKCNKIETIDQQLEEMKDIVFDDDEDDVVQKLQDQRRSLEEEIKDTEYLEDENRDPEELTLSRALENITMMLRFFQLLCENHNLNLQKTLNFQPNAEGQPKGKSIPIVNLFANILAQMLKVINSVTVGFGTQLLDTIVEAIQGPCKESQKCLVNAKVVDSSREFISLLSNPANLSYLGFVPKEDDAPEDDPDYLEMMDEYISKLSTMILSLLEGEQDNEILNKIHFSLSIEDMKARLLTVFGVFLHNHKLYPVHKLQPGQTPLTTSLKALSIAFDHNFLQEVSINKINNRLKGDSFEGVLGEGFEIYILFQNLAQAIPSAKILTQKDFYTADEWKCIEFLRQNTARIEVSVIGSLQRVYFPIRPSCNFISLKSRKALMEDIDRESQQTKVTELMEAIPELMDEMNHNEALQNATIQITPKLMAQLKDFSTVVGTCISLAQVLFLQRVNNYRDTFMPMYITRIVFFLGIIQGVSSGVLIVFYIINKFTLVTKQGWRDQVQSNKGKYEIMENEERFNVNEMSIEQTHIILMMKGIEADEFNSKKGEKPNFGNLYTKMEVKLYNIYFFLQDGVFQYYVLYFGISILGFMTDQLYYSFHLLDVVVRFPTLANVIKAVTMNATQLLMTFMLMFILIYIYATISFFYLQDTVYDLSINPFDSVQIGESVCDTMINCYLSLVTYGFLKGGGIGDVTLQLNYTEDLQKYWIKWAVDVSFFIIVKIAVTNILAGVIIDTFAQLREVKKFMEEDKANVCFICNHERFTFDKNTEGGFMRHISKDHNLWFYVYYIVHLEMKDSSDLTGVESFVYHCYHNEDITWMPRQKALCLEFASGEHDEDAAAENELEKMLGDLKDRAEKLNTMTEKLEKIAQDAADKRKE